MLVHKKEDINLERGRGRRRRRFVYSVVGRMVVGDENIGSYSFSIINPVFKESLPIEAFSNRHAIAIVGGKLTYDF